MSTITLSVPDEIKHKMEQFPEMNWSAVAREAFNKKLIQLAILRSFTKDSELTKEDALRLGRKVNKALSKKYRQLLKEEK